jgi:D-alanyl-D-alanine carboxypeptidase
VAGGGHSALVLRDVLPQYQQMVRSARADGVFLVPLSGFRSERYQEELYTRQLGKAGTADTATLINAPPGYSEHHTGYALDFGDGNQPGTHTQLSFERTAAFRWLKTHAGRFGFEMSFPPGNAQKVSYEPWHWRYVGDREALEVFYKARSGT